MKHTKEGLAGINSEFLCRHHAILDSDVELANKWSKKIEESRCSYPVAGDIIRFTTKHGSYYEEAYLEKKEDYGYQICLAPHVPFVLTCNDDSPCFSTSGGPWENVELTENFKYLGQEEKLFKDWGHCGSCAAGAIQFKATVNVWEYIDPNLMYGEYTTKDWAREYFYFWDGERKDGSPYKYRGECKAFETESDFLAWLTTYKGVEFEGNSANGCQTVTFSYRRKEHLISQSAWDMLDLPTDTRLINATIQVIKFLCDNENHVIEEFRTSNKGEYDQRTHKPYRIARRLIERGEVQRNILKTNFKEGK